MAAASFSLSSIPLAVPAVSAPIPARHNATRALADEDNWENEGGHVARPRIQIMLPATPPNGGVILEAQVRVMGGSLARDLADGRVGQRYNTYAHRARVLRQQKANLQLLRLRPQARG